jgi:hypothetical protein
MAQDEPGYGYECYAAKRQRESRKMAKAIARGFEEFSAKSPSLVNSPDKIEAAMLAWTDGFLSGWEYEADSDKGK